MKCETSFCSKPAQFYDSDLKLHICYDCKNMKITLARDGKLAALKAAVRRGIERS